MTEIKDRPPIYEGRTYKFKMGCGGIFVTVNHDENGLPVEVFCAIGKVGGCSYVFVESLARQISQALRAGVPVDEVVHQHERAACGNGMWNQGKMVCSCPDAIASALKLAMELGAPGTSEIWYTESERAAHKATFDTEGSGEEEDAHLRMLKQADDFHRTEDEHERRGVQAGTKSNKTRNTSGHK